MGLGGRGSVLTRRVTPKPTGERPAREGEATGWAPALYTRRTAYIVCVCLPRAAPLPFRGPSTGVSPSRRPVT